LVFFKVDWRGSNYAKINSISSSLYIYVLIATAFRSRYNWDIESIFGFAFLQSSLGG
jgi:hypothetical protein